MPAQPQEKFWELSEKEIYARFKTSSSGLTSAEAKSRLLKYGKNTVEVEKRRTALIIFLSQLKSPLVIILIVASIISGFLGEIKDTVVIVAIVLLSAALGFVQEYRSEKSLNKLRKKIARKALVLREGKNFKIDAGELVPGDMVVISLGEILPADLRLLKTEDLLINESVLTGESFPQEKISSSLKIENTIPQNLKNLAFMGTYAVQGNGAGIVVATGKNTELGKTAGLLLKKPEETEFQKGIGNFGNFLMKIILVLTLAVFFILSLLKQEYIQSLLFALALAVGISPELLPVILTINLSRGAQKMLKKSVIVKKLMSIEDLGNADVFCTDKTGTLTEGVITLSDYFNLEEQHNKKILNFAYLCNTVTINSKTGGNPLDFAILDFAKNKKEIGEWAKKYQIVDEISFDFKRRRMSVVIKEKNQCTLICKGSAEEILAHSAKIEHQNKIQDISPYRKTIYKKYLDLSKEGLRLLAISFKETPAKAEYSIDDENGLVFLGFLVFSDMPKSTAKEAIKTLEKLGVEIKILTGDNELVSKNIGKKLGIPVKETILGEEIEKLDSKELQKKVNQANIFAKITPEQKLKIINALKASGHTVGYMGDGVNDAPGLHAADVGISFKEATDVAKEAAGVILLEKSLKVLADGIREGRRTFGNTLKYIFATISSNYGNMFSVAVASIFLPFIPLLPSQILLLNFLSDLPMLAISTDKVDPEYIKKPKHWDIKAISRFMAYFGLTSSLFDFATFAFLIYVIKANAQIFRTGWFLESLLTEIAVIFAIRTRRSFFKSKPSQTLSFVAIIVVALVFVFLYSPFKNYFDFVKLSPTIILIVVVLVAVYFSLVEIGKRLFHKRFGI